MALQKMAFPIAGMLLLSVSIFLTGWLKLRAIPEWRDLPKSDPPSLIALFEDTQYSDDFSESRFAQIQSGMRKEDVTGLLGSPIQIFENHGGRIVRLLDHVDGEWHVTYPDLPAGSRVSVDRITYCYSKPGGSDHWYVRAVEFSPGGIVKDVNKSFYVD